MKTAVVTLLLALVLGASGGETEAVRNRYLAALAADPADAEALLGMADLNEAGGRRRPARRCLRAFLRLVYRHARRVEAAIRLAALRPEDPWVPKPTDGPFALYRNAIDGIVAVRVPAGPYRRRLEVDGADVVFDVDLPDYLVDLHETPVSVRERFAWEGGFDVPAYWGNDGWRWLHAGRDRHTEWEEMSGKAGAPYPARGMTYYEARAIARWAGKRIPTDAEWEKAARGGIVLDGRDGHLPNPRPGRRYPWGDEPVVGPEGTYRANLDCVVPTAGGANGDDRDLPVDSLPEGASPYGCLHMAGNATEWTADRWIDDDARLDLPRTSPFVTIPGSEKYDDAVRAVRGGSFKQDESAGEIDSRERRTFASPNMCVLFKAGLRSAADAPPADVSPDVGPLEDEPDPLDAERFYRTAVAAADAGDRDRAWRFGRAALRLVRAGPLRTKPLALVPALRPGNPWREADGAYLNLVDGKRAELAGRLLVDVEDVTVGDLLRFAAEGGYEIDAYWSAAGLAWRRENAATGPLVDLRGIGSGDEPASGLSRFEAEAWARWAGKRLPTRWERRRVLHARPPFPRAGGDRDSGARFRGMADAPR